MPVREVATYDVGRRATDARDGADRMSLARSLIAEHHFGGHPDGARGRGAAELRAGRQGKAFPRSLSLSTVTVKKSQ